MQSTTETTTLLPQIGADYINLPRFIKSKGAIINVQKKDNRSFEYAILSALYHNEIMASHQTPSKYKTHIGKLNFTDIEFPVSLKDIDKFEKKIQKLESMYLVMIKMYTHCD